MVINTIQAIETVYKGFRFRSRLEARWAVFFDHIGWEYEYEKEGYQLNYNVRYLPDFYFPQFDCFGEVKPKVLTAGEYQKCSMLPKGCILLDTSYPEARPYYFIGVSDEYRMYDEWVRDGFGRLIFCQSLYKGHLWFLFGEDYREYSIEVEIEAAEKAKQARFEFRERV